jgi:hypothetical protein
VPTCRTYPEPRARSLRSYARTRARRRERACARARIPKKKETGPEAKELEAIETVIIFAQSPTQEDKDEIEAGIAKKRSEDKIWFTLSANARYRDILSMVLYEIRKQDIEV